MTHSNHRVTQSNITQRNPNLNQVRLPSVTSRTVTKPDTPGGYPPRPGPQTPSWKVPSVAYGFGSRGIRKSPVYRGFWLVACDYYLFGVFFGAIWVADSPVCVDLGWGAGVVDFSRGGGVAVRQYPLRSTGLCCLEGLG